MLIRSITLLCLSMGLLFAQGPELPIGGNGSSDGDGTGSAATQQTIPWGSAPTIVLGSGDNVVIMEELQGATAPALSGQTNATNLIMTFTQDIIGGRIVTFGADFVGVPACAVDLPSGTSTTLHFVIVSGKAKFESMSGDGAPVACLPDGYTDSFPAAGANQALAGLKMDQTFEGNNNFTGPLRIPGGVFASLPGSPTVRMIYYVTDCLTSACTAGSGTIKSMVRYDGSAWVPDSSGSSVTPLTTSGQGYQCLISCQWTVGSAAQSVTKTAVFIQFVADFTGTVTKAFFFPSIAGGTCGGPDCGLAAAIYTADCTAQVGTPFTTTTSLTNSSAKTLTGAAASVVMGQVYHFGFASDSTALKTYGPATITAIELALNQESTKRIFKAGVATNANGSLTMPSNCNTSPAVYVSGGDGLPGFAIAP